MFKILSYALLSSGIFLNLVHAQTLTGAEAMSSAYTPDFGDCPEDFQLVRSVGTSTSQITGPEESAYIASRDAHVLPSWNRSIDRLRKEHWLDITRLLDELVIKPHAKPGAAREASSEGYTSDSDDPCANISMLANGRGAAVWGDDEDDT